LYFFSNLINFKEYFKINGLITNLKKIFIDLKSLIDNLKK